MLFIRVIILSILFILLAALPSAPIDAKSSGINNSPYEPNDSCVSAQHIATDGISQEYAFQTSGDIDWVKFDATSDTEYRIEVTVPFDSRTDVVPELYYSCRYTAY